MSANTEADNTNFYLIWSILGAVIIALPLIAALLYSDPAYLGSRNGADSPIKEQATITDPEIVKAFTEVVVRQGFNCPYVASLIKSKHQTERGQPFMVACSGGFFYQVTVQPRGTAMVEIWK